MYIQSKTTSSWKDKRIKAMDKVISKYNLTTETFIEEYNRVCVSKSKNKQQYKGEKNE